MSEHSTPDLLRTATQSWRPEYDTKRKMTQEDYDCTMRL
jgi:hypothetical protein